MIQLASLRRWWVYLSLLLGVACSPSQAGRNLHPLMATQDLPSTITPFQTASPIIAQITITPMPTPSFLPTSTPWPTVDPTLYATLYVTPTFTFTPTPNYYTQMKELYRKMVGEWWGKMGVTVNRQGRSVQYVAVVFDLRCDMGQICGHYHFDDGCFGELVLDKWRLTFLVFRNLEYSGKANCKNWTPMNVKSIANDRLYFSFAYRNPEGKWVSKGVVLRRK